MMESAENGSASDHMTHSDIVMEDSTSAQFHNYKGDDHSGMITERN
jgi:hypothetical protein